MSEEAETAGGALWIAELPCGCHAMGMAAGLTEAAEAIEAALSEPCCDR